MPQTTAGRISVFTFKEGLLSAVAHDLRLAVERFEIRSDERRLSVEVDPSSMRVEGVMRAGKLDADEPDRTARAEIERTMRERILEVQHHPKIVYEATVEVRGDQIEVSGQLALRGAERPVTVLLERRGQTVTGRAELRPSDWDIQPYKAALGAIRLQDRVVVEVELAVPELW
jgi:polyisoprenoid-binding protein YceI